LCPTLETPQNYTPSGSKTQSSSVTVNNFCIIGALIALDCDMSLLAIKNSSYIYIDLILVASRSDHKAPGAHMTNSILQKASDSSWLAQMNFWSRFVMSLVNKQLGGFYGFNNN
jgi:hypothetical protein